MPRSSAARDGGNTELHQPLATAAAPGGRFVASDEPAGRSTAALLSLLGSSGTCISLLPSQLLLFDQSWMLRVQLTGFLGGAVCCSAERTPFAELAS